MFVYTVNMTKTREVKSSKHLVYSCKYHVVWCTKYRRKVLSEPIELRLKTILLQICQDNDAEILEIETMPDHVHVLVECNPIFGIKRLVGLMKGTSSRLLRQEFPELKSRLPTLWTHSCFIATVGGAPLAIIRQYIENQKKV
jgi:putative transposase